MFTSHYLAVRPVPRLTRVVRSASALLYVRQRKCCSAPSSSCSGVGLVAAVAADLDLQRGQVVQPTLLHLVGETLLLLFDHGAPHPLQRRVVLLVPAPVLLLLLVPLSVATPPLASTAAAAIPARRGRGEQPRRAAARPVVTSGGGAAAVVVAGAESAPQPACRRERALQTPHSKERRRGRRRLRTRLPVCGRV